MSLVLVNSQTLISGNVLKVYDVTGIYNATTNITGWNSPNATRAGTTSATISIYLPDATTPVITQTVTSTVQAATSEEFLLYSFSLTDLGISDTTLPDGVYRIVYTVISGGVTYTNDQYFLSYYSVKCCVFKKFANFVDDSCNCKKDTAELLTQWSMLKAIMFGVAGGNLSEANTMLTKLQRMCDINKCC